MPKKEFKLTNIKEKIKVIKAYGKRLVKESRAKSK